MLKKIFAGVLDEMIIFGVSALGLLVVEGVLRIFGFTMVTTEIFLIINMFVINALYFPLLEGGKYGTTIGKRILKLDNHNEEVKNDDIVADTIEEVVSDDATEEVGEENE
ncbi:MULTISPECIES: RDD family protein [Clostridium]|nr:MULTISPECIES: RDD family protein [Clostridium]MDB2123081.1 RDD family protein [Clostridium paraputrificum]MDU1586653.1 RDD family protein [Clostridium sp.]MDU1977787.1 RDD family protein [Clostridium sp.]MDU1993734.1 RDD family protein [Clostridium sp.]MDU6047818.1 RDD family protein [Clostridium sp.]